ncbi:hypothetical protein CJU89_5833 [Yarrowia sp. B02]|nr:hypothetical protein CJU89_5833 [Yarrowia sp. B02]
MAEEDTKTLHLPYPKAWIQILVDFLYGKTVEGMNMDTAVGLLEMAHTYEVPQLKDYITAYFLLDDAEMNLEASLQGWRASNICEADELQQFFATYIADHVSEIEDAEASKKYTDDQSLELYRQVVKVSANKRRRLR